MHKHLETKTSAVIYNFGQSPKLLKPGRLNINFIQVDFVYFKQKEKNNK